MRSFPAKTAFSALIGLVMVSVAACSSSTAKPAPTKTVAPISSPTASATPIPPPTKFTYTYQAPVKTGGTVVIGDWQFPDTLSNIPNLGGLAVDRAITSGLWGSCLTQLPDLTLLDAAWRPDLCRETPTIANGDESTDGLTTIMRLDPRSLWSDGLPITTDDYLVQYALAVDPKVGGNPQPWASMRRVEKVDTHSIKISWSRPYAPYLSALWGPFCFHCYNTGAYTGFYNPVTGNYNAALAQQLVKDINVNEHISVTSGPFSLQSFALDDSIVLVRNPNYHSNFFHTPSLDKVIFKTTGSKAVLIQAYNAGQYDHVENFDVPDLAKFTGTPASEVLVTAQFNFEYLAFNQRPEARNVKAGGDQASIFSDPFVRRAFTQALDRCTLLKVTLNLTDCADPNIITNEMTGPPAFDFEPSVPILVFDPAAAADALDHSGYRVVNGHRTYKDGKTPITVELVSIKGDPLRDVMLALMEQAYVKALTINVTITTYPANQFYASFSNKGILATGDYDIALLSRTNGPDPSDIANSIDSNAIPSAAVSFGQNYSGVRDANIDVQLAAGGQTFDVPKRKALYQVLQRYIASQQLFVPLYIHADISLTKPKLVNYRQQPTPIGNMWNIADWWTSV